MDDMRKNGIDRRTLMQRGAVGAAGLGTVSLLAACGGSGGSPSERTPPESNSDTSSGGEPARGGTLRVGWVGAGKAETVVPGLAVANIDLFRAQQLYDGLFFIGPDGTPQPALAESAEPNADATVWTIKLRTGVTWHDGSPVTAKDVVAAIRAWGDENQNYSAYIAGQVLFDLKKVRVSGAAEVTLPLLRPYADLPGTLAFYNYLIVKPGAAGDAPAPGTGPFKFGSFTPGSRSVFTANADYWGQEGGPYVDELVIDSSFTDDTARVNALLAGNVDVAPNIPFALAKANEESGQIQVAAASGATYYYAAARVDKPPFNDPRVMQALKLLVDGEQMVNSVFSGYATPSNQVPMKGLPHWTDLPVDPYDPERAKSLLKAAGHDGLKLTLNTAALYPGFAESATLYAQQAQAGGVTIDIKKGDPATYYTPQAGYLKYDFFASYPGGGTSIPSIPNYWLSIGWSGAPYNETHESRFDDLLFKAMAQTDEAKAATAWDAYNKNVKEAQGYIAFANVDYVDGYGNNVRGLEPTTAGWVNNFNLAPAWLA